MQMQKLQSFPYIRMKFSKPLNFSLTQLLSFRVYSFLLLAIVVSLCSHWLCAFCTFLVIVVTKRITIIRNWYGY